jgi:hypothetical protein
MHSLIVASISGEWRHVAGEHQLNLVFSALLITGGAYFLFRQRTFDLFTVAFGGCAFYFLPMLLGYVPDWNAPDPQANNVALSGGAYAVGIGVTAVVLCAAAIWDLKMPEFKIQNRSGKSLASRYNLLAFMGLLGTIYSGRVLDLNKAFVLTQLGYWAVLFETAAALAWIDAFLFRRYAHLAVATGFLTFDLIIGFRYMIVIVFIASLLISLGSCGRIARWRKLPFLSAAAAGIFIILLVITPFRNALLFRLGIEYTELSAPITAKSNSEGGGLRDSVASKEAAPTRTGPFPWREPNSEPHDLAGVATEALGTVTSLPLTIGRLEPFVTQAILSETTRQAFTCAPGRISKLALIVPFAIRLVGPPVVFQSEFQPVLFPNHWAEMAGNIWAEAFCVLGYTGVAIEVVLIMMAIAGIQLSLAASRSSAVPALILSGILLAFYIHRNDLLYELLMIRRVAIIYLLAWLLDLVFAAAPVPGRMFFAPKKIDTSPE